MPEDVPGFDATDTPHDRVGDVPVMGCRSNADCTGSPATPVCDTVSQTCVECITSPDNCRRGTVCDGFAHRCVPGCRSDMDCGGAAPRCRLDTHECVECLQRMDCPRGDLCVGFTCEHTCAGGMCPGGQACCNDLCVNEQTDPTNCAGCGIVCGTVSHGTPACAMGACGIGRCDPGFADCDGRAANGCEISTATDASHCGGCGIRCAPGQTCTGGTCTTPGCSVSGCGTGLACCSNVCTPVQSDPNNCGGCGVACNPIAHGAAGCTGASCTVASCDRGFADCDRIEMNGCEASLVTDNANCGACGNACAPGSVCSGSVCVPLCGGGMMCPGGTVCCGMSCAITSSDPNNCGTCGRVCPPIPNGTAACNASTCGIGACTRGFADCNNVAADGCEVTLATDVNNCGGCGVRCGAGASCVAGVCTTPMGCPGTPCGANEACCAGTCRTVRGTDAMNCGGCNVVCPASTPVCMMGACCTPGDAGTGVCGAMVCPGTQINCAGTCVDESNDVNNCGGCDIRCGTGQSCVGGFCRSLCGGTMCSTGTTCCGTSCVDTNSDLNNCGGCGTRCGAGQMCFGGRCVGPCDAAGVPCSPTQSCCGTTCRDVTTDPSNCGGCNVVCPNPANATATCVSSMCGLTCNAGFGNCDGNAINGCETALNTDRNNCGMCGRACATGSNCVGGTCVVTGCNGGPACGAGQTCCTSGCVDTTSSASNCGACGRVCNLANATSACVASACVVSACAMGFGNCDGVASNGCESNLQTDGNHCGTCSTACGSGLTCVAGMCQPPSTGSEGAFLPIANPTYLSPGVHNFTTITVPAGAVVYVAGAGPQAGTLDLRATGHIQIDGTIDVSGGPGTQAIVASSSTQIGHAGTGGYTGEVRSAAVPATACEFDTGATGPNGPPVMGTAGTCFVVASTACLSRGDANTFIFTAQPAQYGGGAGVFTGYRAYGSGGGGYAGGGGGALGATFRGEADCSGVTAGGGATTGRGGSAMNASYNGGDGTLGQTQCDATMAGIPRAWVGGGGGGSIGRAAASDLAVTSTFYPGSGGGGGSADYLQRPAFGGSSGGGGGGGVLRLWTTADMVVNGQLLARGGVGGDAYLGTPAGAGCDPQPGSAGGGGSGGLIYLIAPSITTGAASQISTAGGHGGVGSVFATGGAGGAGGIGRIRVSVTPSSCSLAGTFTPALVSGCTPAPATAGSAYLAAYPN